MSLLGNVTGRREAIVSMVVYGQQTQERVEAVIDTGFDGHLLLPDSMIHRLALPQLGATVVTLGDGTSRLMRVYELAVQWLNERRLVEVLAGSADEVLLGTALLAGHRLTIDYRSATVEIV